MGKGLLVALLLTVLTLNAEAWVSTAIPTKDYGFKFTLKGEKLEVHEKAPSYEEAYEHAAKSCFQHFKAGQRVSEDVGLDIIDACANPRTI